jgi:hypothetical protein
MDRFDSTPVIKKRFPVRKPMRELQVNLAADSGTQHRALQGATPAAKIKRSKHRDSSQSDAVCSSLPVAQLDRAVAF